MAVELLNPTVAEVYEATVEADVHVVSNTYTGPLSQITPAAALGAEKSGLIKKKAALNLTPTNSEAPVPTAKGKK